MADMLGIMITKYENLDHIAGIVKAGTAAGKNGHDIHDRRRGPFHARPQVPAYC